MAKVVWVVAAIDQDGDVSATVWESEVIAKVQAFYLEKLGVYTVVEILSRSIDTAADLPSSEDIAEIISDEELPA